LTQTEPLKSPYMFFLYPVGKIQKNSPKESVFVNLSLKNAVPYCQEYTPTDFGSVWFSLQKNKKITHHLIYIFYI